MRIGLPIALFLAPVLALCLSPADSAAHDKAKGIIKERMELMSSVGREMKCMGQMVRGTIPLDSDKISAAAKQISTHGRRMETLFPKGSKKGLSRASNRIWEQWDLFLFYASKLVTAADRLEFIAGKGNHQAIEASYKALGKTCGGCHKLFRTDKKTTRISSPKEGT